MLQSIDEFEHDTASAREACRLSMFKIILHIDTETDLLNWNVGVGEDEGGGKCTTGRVLSCRLVAALNRN